MFWSNIRGYLFFVKDVSVWDRIIIGNERIIIMDLNEKEMNYIEFIFQGNATGDVTRAS